MKSGAASVSITVTKLSIPSCRNTTLIMLTAIVSGGSMSLRMKKLRSIPTTLIVSAASMSVLCAIRRNKSAKSAAAGKAGEFLYQKKLLHRESQVRQLFA